MHVLARIGFAARGLVYILIGSLAALAGIGMGGGTGGSRSALSVLMTQPFGYVILAFLAAGLACFALWRLIEAWTDADERGTDSKGIAIRAAHTLSGFVYGGLAFTAAAMVVGLVGGRTNDDRSVQDWSATLMREPYGRWAVAIGGVIVLLVGLGFVWKAVRGNVLARLRVPDQHCAWVTALGRAGYGARGVIFALVGFYLALSGWHARSSEAKGFGGALNALREQPYGWLLLTTVALGLMSFGMFGLAQARYRRIRT